MAIDFKYWKDGQPVIEDDETATNDFKYWADGQSVLYVTPAETTMHLLTLMGVGQ